MLNMLLRTKGCLQPVSQSQSLSRSISFSLSHIYAQNVENKDRILRMLLLIKLPLFAMIIGNLKIFSVSVFSIFA